MRTDFDYARELDRIDPLVSYRERFVIDGPEIYLDGNSLGRLPKAALTLAEDLISRQWGRRLIRGWNEGWIKLSERIGAKIARLIGASADEVLIADSTTVNLFKLAVAALRARPERHEVVTDDLNFPSDVHALGAAVEMAGTGQRLRIIHSQDGIDIPDEALSDAFSSDTALVALSHTTFKSGFTYDLNRVTQMAHRAGVQVLWDVSHSVGAVPLRVGEAGADFAVGCTYKYLCGGPGAPAFLYVRRDLQEVLLNPIAGWFGRDDPFGFALDYRSAAGIKRFLTGTPPVLSTALIEPGLDLLLEAGIERVREKSIKQTEFLIALWKDWLEPIGFVLKSPREASRRGSHVSLGHPEGWRIGQALIERAGIIPDFRPPDNLRLGVCPLYTTYSELLDAMSTLRQIVVDRAYEEYSAKRSGVT
jgi:kynureninase